MNRVRLRGQNVEFPEKLRLGTRRLLLRVAGKVYDLGVPSFIYSVADEDLRGGTHTMYNL
jgi:hypothetical protein